MDKRSLKKLQRLLNDFPNKVQELAEKNDYIYQKKAKREMTQIARMAVDNFYDSYAPHVYDRWGDLYNAFKVTVNNSIWKIDYKSNYMRYRHRVSNDYIFELSFIGGYHGGAVNGPNHPAPGSLYGPNLIGSGIPYYREFPYYKTWTIPAKKSESPYLIIEDKIGNYFDEVNTEMNKTFQNVVAPYMKEIKEQIIKTFQTK